MGQGRAGKTSTLKALTGQQFEERERSTHGLSATLPLAALELKSSLVRQWRLVEQSEHEIHGLELQKSCAAYVAERLCERHDTEDVAEDIEGPQKMRVDLVAKMIQGDEEPEAPVMLKTWDFGGQREYYVAHKEDRRS